VALTPIRREADLPGLRIVPTASLVPHEEFDLQRSEPLVARLRNESHLKNPPIVAPIEGEDRYIVLDGTNRAMAMTVLAYPHIVVQVVDYESPGLLLETWYHLVTEMPSADFLFALRTVEGLMVEPTDLLHARAELARRLATAYVIMPPDRADGHHTVYLLYAEGDLHRRTMLLNRLVHVYRMRGRIHRANTDHIEHLVSYYPNVTALVVFPHYQASEIVELARQGAYLPPGITRHIIPGRVLRINFPLEVLAEDRPIEEKNAWLQE